MKLFKERVITHYSNGHFIKNDDLIAVEHAVTIRINNEEFMTIVCSPEYIEDMVIGFLASEGVIPRFSDIQGISISEDSSKIDIQATKKYSFYEKMLGKRYITSCCGMSRQGFVFAHDALTAKKMNDISITLTPEDCFSLMKQMNDTADIFRKTGGVHNAALCSSEGVIVSRMDVGRHNALDKIYGHCLRNNIPVHDKIIVFSGRISSEILLKVAKIGCEIVLSKSAPTELALELAEDLGITTVGFIRGESFNLYTHPERIRPDA